MASANSTSKKWHFDIAIIGGGLAGLITAFICSRKGQRVALIEARDELGGSYRRVQTLRGPLPSSLGFVPDTEEARQALDWLAEYIERDLFEGTEEEQARTFDSGNLKRFLGFGDKGFQSVDELAYYNQASRLKLKIPTHEWVEKMTLGLSAEVLSLSEVTQLNVEDKKVISAVINGDKTLTADAFVFSAPIPILPNLIEGDGLSAKTRQRLAKSRLWTTVSLHLSHSQVVSEDFGLHFLMGSKTDVEPCLGRFMTPEEERQDSIWISLVPSELTEDNDFVGNVIKNIKKQIKRPYPQALESVCNEKIVVTEFGHGFVDLKLKEDGRLPELDNLFVASHLLRPERGLLGSVLMAREAVQWLLPAQPAAEPPAPEPEATL